MRWNKGRLDIVKKMHEEGHAPDVIAKAFGVSEQSVRAVMYRLGLTPRHVSRRTPEGMRYNKHWTEEEERLLTMHQLGVNDYAAIGEVLGRTASAVKGRLAALSIRQRKNDEPEPEPELATEDGDIGALLAMLIELDKRVHALEDLVAVHKCLPKRVHALEEYCAKKGIFKKPFKRND